MATTELGEGKPTAGMYSKILDRIKSHRIYHRHISIQAFAAASGVLFMSQAKTDSAFWLGVLIFFVAVAKFIHIDYHNRRWEAQGVGE